MQTDDGFLVIGDDNRDQWEDPNIPGEGDKKRGLIPRNYATHPVGFYPAIPSYKAVAFDTLPTSDWPTRIRALKEGGARISDARRRGNKGGIIPSRDQNGKGYCWRHSGTAAHLCVRALNGQPYADLSAYAGACMIKDFRDEGGWGAQGVDDIIKRGDPTSEFWPQRSMSRANDNPRTWENAALHRIDEGWIDLEAAQYDRNLTWAQVVTCVLSGWPVIVDYNWWGHSVCAMDAVDGASVFDTTVRNRESGKKMTLRQFHRMWDMNDPVTAGVGLNIWNSWGDSWSNQGEGYLPPQKAVPDGSVAVRTVTASAA